MSGIDRINAWASKHTEGMIKNILSRPLPDMTGALINAMYFKGLWANPFDKKNTHKATFHGNTKDSEIDMMSGTGQYPVYSADTYTLLQMKFGNGAYVMNFILPKADVDGAMHGLSKKELSAAISAVRSSKVNLQVPKVEEMASINLTDVLGDMGMKSLFADGALEGIPSGFKASAVNQSIAFKMDEEGATAAAVTNMGIDAAAFPQESIDFRLDRPFIYFIHEKSTGAILLMGKIENL
ncbi:MAG: hypothetical protein NC043_06005 [Muribaculaceae bacterium]|nr:hypothetical protein [Muribaculaceae bacterium]